MENKKLFEIKKRILLEHLVKSKYLKDKRLIGAFLEIPLEEFIPKKYIDPLKIYEDIPNLFYYENPENYRTISAPHMISIMLGGLDLKEKDDLLILGAKSGYIAALAHKLAPKGELIILEANSEIASFTSSNLKKLDLHHNITVNIKNPLEGMPELSPWQKILVTGAIKQEKIYPLLKQLDPKEGVLYAPIGEDFIQIYTQILRVNNEYFGKRQLQVRFTPLMTQIEFDDLELITDFEEFEEIIEVKEDPSKVDKILGKSSEKISIKYTSSILDDLDLEPLKVSPVKADAKQRDIVVSYLEKIQQIVKNLKTEDDIDECFNCVDDIEFQIENLKKFKKTFDVKIKKIQNILNQIRSYNIIRKELEKKETSGVIEKKVEIINKQIEEFNALTELLKDEIKRLKKL